MDLRYTDSELAFREELRAWLRDVLPSVPPEPHRNDWEGRRAWDTGWQRMPASIGRKNSADVAQLRPSI